MSPMEDKIGVFICTGYGIADALDVDALCKVATGEYKVPFCKTIDSCEGPFSRCFPCFATLQRFLQLYFVYFQLLIN